MKNTQKLTVKDLVNVGIFSALYMVLTLIVMIPAGFAPILWLLWPCMAGIVGGVFFTLLMMKSPKPGTAFLLCLITGILFFVTGECTWVIVMTCVLGGILAELVRKVLGYRSFKGIALAGGCAALGLIGSPLPMWLFQEEYMKSILEMGMAQDYVASLQAMTSIWTLLLMMIAALIGGVLGTILGRSMMKKHFEKAGIV